MFKTPLANICRLLFFTPLPLTFSLHSSEATFQTLVIRLIYIIYASTIIMIWEDNLRQILANQVALFTYIAVHEMQNPVGLVYNLECFLALLTCFGCVLKRFELYCMAGNFGGNIFWWIAENMPFGGIYFGG